MRLREAPLIMLAPHAFLMASTAFGFGAAEFASHRHTAGGPVAFVEIVLALWLFAFAVRDAFRGRVRRSYALASRPRRHMSGLPLWAGCVSVIAIATLFGMEYAESGSAAFGLGWLGGALVPGVIALVSGIVAMVGVLSFALAGHLAAFDHLIGLFAAALARFIATFIAPTSKPLRLLERRPSAGVAPVGRHAGLRAPPLTATR